MKKNVLILPLLFAFLFSNAQNIDFVKANPQPELIEIYAGSFASGDIDGDGDNDLLMSGQTPSRKTALYLNDGNGNFTEMENTPFINTTFSVTIFEDLDGDGDLDLFFSGNGFNIQEYTRIYLNDGSGIFTELANPSLPQFSDSGVDIADVDGDGDKDILISVRDLNDVFVADVFLNDGNAIFTPSGSTVLAPVLFGAVKFVDVESDGDADIIISGEQEDESQITKLYLNDGDGNYTAAPNMDFVQINADDISVADTDNDGDMDVLMSGSFGIEPVSFLYINDGSGNFSELASANLQQTFSGKNTFADLDNDGDQDIIIIGSQDGGLPNIYNIVYENLSNNEFIPVDTIGGEYIPAMIVDDFNGDELADVIIQGFADRTNVYWNNSTVTSIFDDLTETSSLSIFPNPSSGELTVDLENDISMFDLKIYTSGGQLAYEQSNVSGTKTELQLDLLAGIYIVRLESEKTFVTRKLVIVK